MGGFRVMHAVREVNKAVSEACCSTKSTQGSSTVRAMVDIVDVVDERQCMVKENSSVQLVGNLTCCLPLEKRQLESPVRIPLRVDPIYLTSFPPVPLSRTPPPSPIGRHTNTDLSKHRRLSRRRQGSQ